MTDPPIVLHIFTTPDPPPGVMQAAVPGQREPQMMCGSLPEEGAPLIGISLEAWASGAACPTEATMCVACIAAAGVKPSPRAPGFDMRTSALGMARESYEPGRDATHLAIPLRVYGPNPATCERRAEAIAGVLSMVVGDFPDVQWVRSHIEGAYALACNLWTALAALEPDDLAHVLAAIPSLEDLRRLLTPVEAVAPG
jgi:hypothetical protein